MGTHGEKPGICMIVQDPAVRGGIAAVTGGYYGSRLERDFEIRYVESYCDGSKYRKFIKAVRAYRSFRELLRNERPDLVHVHSSFGASFFRKYPIIRMAHQAGIPVINHIHGSALEEFYLRAPAWKKHMVRKCYGWCDRLIALSDEWKERLSVIVPPEKIEVLPNYSRIFPEMLSGENMEKRFAKRQILYLGRFDRLKGVSDIPAIAEQVKKVFPDIRFVLGGTGETDPVTEEIARRSLGDTVLLPGWLLGDEKTKLLEESTLFLLPSHMEAMPVSVLEAMGYALPVISCDVGGIPKVVSDGINGRLYAPGDTDGMAEGIISYLSDRAAWEEAGRQSLGIAEKRFGFDTHIDRLEEIYRSVLRRA